MKPGLFILLLLTLSLQASTTLSVRIYYNRDMLKAGFSPNNANYRVYGEEGKLFVADIHRNLVLNVTGDSISLTENNKVLAVSSFFSFIPLSPDSAGSASFEIRPDAGTKARHFPGALQVTASGGSLVFTNLVDVEHYIPGVIQGEVGSLNPYEFKKMKAIIIRTYALSNMGKHAEEGFHLCDKVHCQVYNGTSYQKEITRAVKETWGQVLVDDSLRLISTLFFSNCGGQTSRAEDVWFKPVPYLCSVNDSFCLQKAGAAWTRKIPRSEWLAYFEKKFNYPVQDTALQYPLLHFEQKSRMKYFLDEGNCIPLRTIREDWKLRSTWFSVSTAGDQVILKGKGFGHGVGLCQEGAMEMARLGYTVKEIIDHYYKGVLLVNLDRLEFYRSGDQND